MRAAIHVNRHEHQQVAAAAMRAGLERHGVEVQYGSIGDFVVTWGARREDAWRLNRPVLVLERGHVGDRMRWTSCGWDGLGRRGRYPAAPSPDRWEHTFAGLLRPWRRIVGHALILGQVEDDVAVRGIADGVLVWAARVAAELHRQGWDDVRYRPHPLTPRVPVPVAVAVTRGRTLAEDLTGAALCVSWNSTAGVDAVLAGVPTVTLDEGAMAWPVAAHDLDSPPLTPERAGWAADLAWTQWTLDEITRGDAWEALGPLLLPDGNRPPSPAIVGPGATSALTGAAR